MDLPTNIPLSNDQAGRPPTEGERREWEDYRAELAAEARDDRRVADREGDDAFFFHYPTKDW